MRAIINLSIGMVLIALGVVACGGGGSGGTIIGPGGGGGSSSSSSSSSGSTSCVASGGAETSTVANVATVTVDGGPVCAPGEANILYVNVAICAPGSTTNCQTIDHVQVDTGSYGLRILSEVLEPTLASALTPVAESQSGKPLAECTQFADGYSWGPIKSADVQISQEKAAGIGIQVIGDPAYLSSIPSDCSGTGGQEEDSVAYFGANGILGVGPFVTDCGSACAAAVQPGWYYTCDTPSSCVGSTVSEAQQVSNPVAFFTTDNNGVLIQLPGLAAGGQPTATGSLIFGIDTQSNNALTSGAAVLNGDSNDGSIVTTYPATNGTQFNDGYIDSGSNAYFFQDDNIPQCSQNQGFYCPATSLNLSAINQSAGLNGTPSTVNFRIDNADNLDSADTAFDGLAGTPLTSQDSQQNQSTDIFDWGLPFFFNRSVYTAIDGRNTSAGPGPYFAYTN